MQLLLLVGLHVLDLVLGSILALSATEASISKGILLLSFYSLGLAIPFILSGYYMSKFLTTRKGFSKYYGGVTKTGGAILLITGISDFH